MTYVESLPYLLSELKLPAAKEHWHDMAENAQKENLSYGDFLAKLLDLDLTLKEQNRQQRSYKQSKLPPAKTLSSFDFSGAPSINKNEMVQLATNPQWVNNNENLILLGASGAGKTHLAASTWLSRSIASISLPSSLSRPFAFAWIFSVCCMLYYSSIRTFI